MSQVDIAEAKAKLQELLEIALNGEEVVITKDSHPVVKLVPVPDQAPQKRPRAQFGSMKDLIWVADDFDEPLTEEFKEYIG
ncbi:type II toxin-antitoxin system prevent-host-death family antitoxin [Phormidium pseudopriestleyi FRX01]|uniref:Antitoxin n=1 Tax=Phormidium pseudopriestleyi FRX01 TaxID=1759528 RepID=A0ABS3FPS3_9CYAN|nr:type II toxin-antitoxin system prevent-host-death family antitoxin [Phormidium pseudopriestleyi]MBO0349070.1 type II toxin-antitoxin system prevent-host-death family antitoxin [Phormidium pseudopriestleyi FRX01]